MKTFSHWSNVHKRDVRFHIYSPDEEDLYPLVYIIPDSNGEVGQDEVVRKSNFQKWAYRYKLAVVIPDVTHEEVIEGGCFDETCRSHRMTSLMEKTHEYVSQELDYVISENQPVIKGRQSIIGIGRGSNLALMCGVNSPRNYNSLSVFINSPY